MGMCDCIRCWDTPCTCGYDYRNLSKAVRQKLAAVILGVEQEELEGVTPEDHPMKDPPTMSLGDEGWVARRKR